MINSWIKNNLVRIFLFFGVLLGSNLLIGCSTSSNMFNHTHDYKNSQERAALAIPKGIPAQALSDQYAIPDLTIKKTTVASKTTETSEETRD